MNNKNVYSSYDLMMMPLEKLVLDKYRSGLVARASGDVLEIGAGSGVNLSYYNRARVRSLTVTDREPDDVLEKKLQQHGFSKSVTADISHLPFADNSFDTVVMTLVLCSVPNPKKGIREILRVLKPDGQFIFIEHVASCSSGLRKAQQAVTPAWKRIAGNCHLDRDSVKTIQEQGFAIENMKKSMFCLITGGVGKKV